MDSAIRRFVFSSLFCACRLRSTNEFGLQTDLFDLLMSRSLLKRSTISLRGKSALSTALSLHIVLLSLF
jgi:hypothetical protein